MLASASLRAFHVASLQASFLANWASALVRRRSITRLQALGEAQTRRHYHLQESRSTGRQAQNLKRVDFKSLSGPQKTVRASTGAEVSESLDEAEATAPGNHSSAAGGGEALMYSAEVKCRGDIADALVEALLSFGAQSCSIEDANLGKPAEQEIYSSGPIPWQQGPRQLWHESRIRALFKGQAEILSAITSAALSVGLEKAPPYIVEEVGDEDWVQQVQDMYEPVKVADKLWVVPHWCKQPEPDALAILMDPGLAFGTGEHPTTRLCLRFLKRVVHGGERVLDYGCGSGVLSIAALKLGAITAVGVDIDPLAIRSSAYNASLNGLNAPSLQVFLATADGPDPVPHGAATQEIQNPTSASQPSEADAGDKMPTAEYDIVVANILLNPLIELAERLASHAKPGGKIGLSGILTEQVEKVRGAYNEYLEDISVSEEDGWACVQGQRKSV